MLTYLFLLISIAAFINIILVCSIKQNKYKKQIGSLIIFLSVIWGVLYFYMLHFSGGADRGHTVSQTFLPILICVVMCAIGISALFCKKK